MGRRCTAMSTNHSGIFMRANKEKKMFDLRSEVDNHLAPNVTLISNDNIKVKCHSIILVTCPYFRVLFKRDKTGNSKLIFDEGLPGDVLEFVIKYIYIGEYSLLDVDKLPEVLRATSEEKYNIPELAKCYLLEQMDAPGGFNQANWHLFYKNGIKLVLGEEYCNRIYAFLKEEHPDFYMSEEFNDLTYEQICKLMSSPNLPFKSNTTLTEASLYWIRHNNETDSEKINELSKLCTNPIQNGNSSPRTENSQMLDTQVLDQSINGALITPTRPQPTANSDHPSTTEERSGSISPLSVINTGNLESNLDDEIPESTNSLEPSIPSPCPTQSGSCSLSASQDQTQSAPISNPTPSTSYAHPQPQSDPNPTPPATRKRTRANSFSKNLKKKRSNVVEIYHPPKNPLESAKLLFFGKPEASEPGYFWSYSFQSGEIKKAARLPIENLESMSLLASQDRIYSIGGSVKYYTQDLVQSFLISDLENMDKAWDKGPKLNRTRKGVSALIFQNTIYLFPGNGSYKSGIEKWDISDKAGGWEDNNKHMMYNRDGFGVTLLNGNIIYMIGGEGAKNNGNGVDLLPQALATAESYNINDGTHTLLPSMNQARYGLGVVALKGRIYAIGGLDHDDEETTSVESYRPGDSNWKQLASMNQPRAYGYAFVFDDTIYVVGGNDGNPTMERYSLQDNTWTMVDINLPLWAELSSSVILGRNDF